ncbi:MAG: lipocalin-like domain-containing protein [Cyclobacteriaceae bacterium]
MNKLPIAIICIFLFTACSEKKTEQARQENPLEGLWSLHIMEQKDPETGEWRLWRDGMQGYLLYDATENMALHLTVDGYQDTDLQFPNFNDSIPDEALRHLTGSYVYFAKYSVNENGNTVQHARISHSNPAEWNDVVMRRYSFSGDTLILQPAEDANSGLRLKWVKQ